MRYLLVVMAVMLLIGCGEPQIQIRYVEATPYKFEKISLEGVYIELSSKEVQHLCTPALLDLNNLYTGVVDFYDWQIDAYSEVAEGVADDNKREE